MENFKKSRCKYGTGRKPERRKERGERPLVEEIPLQVNRREMRGSRCLGVL
jgi:hypothetical protein